MKPFKKLGDFAIACANNDTKALEEAGCKGEPTKAIIGSDNKAYVFEGGSDELEVYRGGQNDA